MVSDLQNPNAMVMPVIGKVRNRRLALIFGTVYPDMDNNGIVRDRGSSIVGKAGAGDVVLTTTVW